MRLPNIVFFGGLALLLVAGMFIGVYLSHLPKLESFKLLNIAGLTYDLFGLITLSELIASSSRWKRFIVMWVAGVLLWGQSVVPLGVAAGAWMAAPAPSSSAAMSFFGLFWAYSILPLALLDAKVFYPRLEVDASIDLRARRIGFGLLVAGGLVQLVAAFKDLHA